MDLTAILKIKVAILKMEKIALARIDFLIRKVWRINAESVILVSGCAQLLWNLDTSRSTIPKIKEDDKKCKNNS